MEAISSWNLSCILKRRSEGYKMSMLVLGVLFCAICAARVSDSVIPPLSPEFYDISVFDNIQYNKSTEDVQVNCQFSTMKGRRRYQEDRISCNLDMNTFFFGHHDSKFVKVGVVAVFDGHIGEEASDMASKLFLYRFFVNALHDNYLYESHHEYEPTLGSVENGHARMEQRLCMGKLKNALIKTIKDVDVAITKEAVEHKLASGTTAVIALLVDDQILVSNVGDSKALLCSENAQSSQRGDSPHLYAEELTRDHTALIDEERARIEAAGGFIIDQKVPLVMGHFPITRAIGDVPLKRYGVIAEPEVTGWRQLSEKDRYLVVASDGIFESLSPQDVCNLLEGEGDKTSAADLIVEKAYSKGSSDNLSVVVVPLSSPQNSTHSVS